MATKYPCGVNIHNCKWQPEYPVSQVSLHSRDGNLESIQAEKQRSIRPQKPIIQACSNSESVRMHAIQHVMVHPTVYTT